MNGVHDLGGMHGFGPINPDRNEPVFHHEWERRVFGMMIAVLGTGSFGVDEFRHAVERLPPALYLNTTYYEHWLLTLEKLLGEHGILSENELTTKKAEPPGRSAIPAAVSKDALLGMMSTGASLRLPEPAPPRFHPGDRVLVRNINPEHHTRLPRYARGKHGIVERLQGVFVFPDTAAHGQGNKPQQVYNVRFTARELWGSGAPAQDSLTLDLFEDYLE